MSGHHTMCSCLCPLSAFPHPEALVTSFSLFTHLSSHTLINPTNINWGLGFPCGSVVKNPPAMQGTWVGSLGWERSPGVGNGNPLQYSCLGNPMDRGVWRATVHGVAKSQTRLSANQPKCCIVWGTEILELGRSGFKSYLDHIEWLSKLFSLYQ